MMTFHFRSRVGKRTHVVRFDLGSDQANKLMALKFAWDHNCRITKVVDGSEV